MKTNFPAYLPTDTYGVTVRDAKIAYMEWGETETVASDNDAIMTSTAGGTTSAGITVTENLGKLPCVRTLTVTAGGTAADIKAGKVKIFGTDFGNEPIEEEFQFSDNTGATVAGSKAFKTVTKVFIPQQDGTGATFTVGTGEKLGLPIKFSSVPLFMAITNGSADAGAISTSETVAGSTFDSNFTLSGKVTKLAIIV